MRKDKKAYNAYMKRYMLARYHARMTAIREALGNKCAKCGSTENLEIDHIDYRLKQFTVSNRAVGANLTDLAKELEKCQLLCRTCHIEKTTTDLRHQRPVNHGSQRMYVRYGCRCVACSDGNRQKNSEYKKRHKEKLNLVRLPPGPP